MGPTNTMNIQQLMQQFPELGKPANWKRVTPKSYKAYMTIVPVEVEVSNKSLSARFKVPAKQVIICRPYQDIRIGLVAENFKDSEGRSGQAFINAHAKKQCINGGHEPQSVLPWTPVTYVEPVNAPVKMAIMLDPKVIHNVVVAVPTTSKQVGNNAVMINNSIHQARQGKVGDYLVAEGVPGPNNTFIPNLNTIDVIDGRTFTEMFDMRAFAGQNIETGVDAYTVPDELVEFTGLVKKTALELINNFAQSNGFKAVIDENSKATLASINLPVDNNNIPMLNEENSLKTLRKPVSIDFTSFDDVVKLRVVLKNYQGITQLLRKAAKRATMFSKSNIQNIAHGSDYMSLDKYFEMLAKKR